VKSGNYINLARCALTDVCFRNIGVSNQNYHLYTAHRQPVICLSAVMCTESFLECVPPKGLRKHGLGCIYHTQEYERNIGFLASASGCEGFHSQIYQNTVRFETMSNFKQEKGTVFIACAIRFLTTFQTTPLCLRVYCLLSGVQVSRRAPRRAPYPLRRISFCHSTQIVCNILITNLHILMLCYPSTYLRLSCNQGRLCN
jgi:hypothetical protein